MVFFLSDIKDFMASLDKNIQPTDMIDNVSKQLILLSYVGDNLTVPLHFTTCHRTYEFILRVSNTVDTLYNSTLWQLLSEYKLGGLYIDVVKRRVFVVGYSLTTAATSKKNWCYLKLHGFYISYAGEITYHKEIWTYECPLLAMMVNGNRTIGKNLSAQIPILQCGDMWYLHFDLRNSKEDLSYNNSISMELNETNLSVNKMILNESETGSVIDSNVTEYLIDLSNDNTNGDKTGFYLQGMCAQSPYYTYLKN